MPMQCLRISLDNMLSSRVVFITGAARGIGRGVAEAVLESGGKVVLADLDCAALELTKTELCSTHAVSEQRIFTTEIDVADAPSVQQAFEAALENFGRLDGLVNNAGITRLGPDIEAGVDDWQQQLNVNLVGTHNCCQKFAELLIASGRPGAIVNIASNAGKVGYPNMAGYNASKAAVISLTRTLAGEWAEHDINVNGVCPGGVDTPMLMEVAVSVGKRIGEDPVELLKTMVPAQMGRHIQPNEIGRVVAFLLSDAALIIRGQSINADGGDTPY